MVKKINERFDRKLPDVCGIGGCIGVSHALGDDENGGADQLHLRWDGRPETKLLDLFARDVLERLRGHC